MSIEQNTHEAPAPAGEQGFTAQRGAPGGARQHVRSGTDQGAVARPGGATQNSGGAIIGNLEQGDEPGRGAD